MSHGGVEGIKADINEFTLELGKFGCLFPAIVGAPVGFVDSPPPSPRSPKSTEDGEHPPPPPPPQERRMVGVRKDLAEFGGELKNAIAKISSALKRKVKIADSTGVMRAEVLNFVKDMRRECWEKFPQVPDHFDLSRHQREHIETVERLAPSLAALKRSLCPIFMPEGRFWKIYFMHLHSRLNKHESDFLSTDQIMEEIQGRLNSEHQHAAVDSFSSVMSVESVDTQVGVMHMKNNKENRVVSESQNLMPEGFSLMTIEKTDDEQVADEPQVHAITSNEARLVQYIDSWFDTTAACREMDVATETRQRISSKERKDGDNIAVLQHAISPVESVDQDYPVIASVDPDYSLISSNERLRLSTKMHFGDRNNRLQKLPSEGLPDDEFSDWNRIDDSSDYEMI